MRRKRDYVTPDGRFATEMGFDIVTLPEAGKGVEATKAVCKIINATPGWSVISPNQMACKTKLQLKSLKGLGTAPLSGDDRKLLGITTPPRDAALVACAKGCARLISSGRAATPEGKKEAEIIIEAASNANLQMGQLLVSAVSAGTSKTPPPTRATPRSAPFMDPVVQRVVEVMFDALRRINPTSVAENREYYLEVFGLGDTPPGTPVDVIVRNLRATPPKAGDLATIPPASRARITELTRGQKVWAWGHTHGGPDPRFDNENFSPGDLAHSKGNEQHGGLGTPGGRFLFFNVDQNVEYDLSPMFGSLPT